MDSNILWSQKNKAKLEGDISVFYYEFLSQNTIWVFLQWSQIREIYSESCQRLFWAEQNVGFSVMTRSPSEIFIPPFLERKGWTFFIFYWTVTISIYFCCTTCSLPFWDFELCKNSEQSLISTCPIYRKTSPKRDLEIPLCPRH